MSLTEKNFLRKAFAFTTGTLLSRLSGLARDIVTAYVFGASASIAAFFVAFRLANIFRRLFGEGALLTGFIPFFETLRQKSEEEGSQFYRDNLYSFFIFLVPFVGTIELFLFLLKPYVNASSQEILSLTSLMFPSLIFISLSCLSSAMLQCHGFFFLTGSAPIIFNFMWIASALMANIYFSKHAVYFLSLGISIAFFFQWLVLSIASIKLCSLSVKKWLTPKVFSKDIRQMLFALIYGIIGVGSMQINSAIDVIFARFASLSGPAYLSYAIRMQQLPLALFSIAIAMALLPILTRLINQNNFACYIEKLQEGIVRSVTILLPCSFGILSLGYSAIQLVFLRGHFTPADAAATTYCLWAYGVGLVPSGIAILLAPAFFAQKDYKTPMKASLLSVGLNIIFNTCLVFILHLDAYSVALSTSAASYMHMLYLLQQLQKKVGYINKQNIYHTLFKVFACSLLAFICSAIFAPQSFSKQVNLIAKLQQFFFPASLFVLAFILTAIITKTRDYNYLLGLWRKRSD